MNATSVFIWNVLHFLHLPFVAFWINGGTVCCRPYRIALPQAIDAIDACLETENPSQMRSRFSSSRFFSFACWLVKRHINRKKITSLAHGTDEIYCSFISFDCCAQACGVPVRFHCRIEGLLCKNGKTYGINDDIDVSMQTIFIFPNREKKLQNYFYRIVRRLVVLHTN